MFLADIGKKQHQVIQPTRLRVSASVLFPTYLEPVLDDFRTIAPHPATAEAKLAGSGVIVRLPGKFGPYSTEIRTPTYDIPYYKPGSCQLRFGDVTIRAYSTEILQFVAGHMAVRRRERGAEVCSRRRRLKQRLV